MRLRIKEAGLTQRSFAKSIGVRESFVSMVIGGKRHLTVERAVNSARVLNCRVEDLNEWHEVPLSELQNGDE